MAFPIVMEADDWRFIQIQKCGLLKDEWAALFRYELAREVSRESDLHRCVKEVFPKHFERTPYLQIPEATRREALPFASKRGSRLKIDHFDPMAPDRCLSHIWRFAADEDEGNGNGDLNTPLEPPKPHHIAFLALTLDLRFPDSVIIDEVKSILEKHRQGVRATFGFRGSTKIEAALKQLAIARLLRELGSIKAVQDKLADAKFANPYPGGESGYYDARDALRRWRRKLPVFSKNQKSIADWDAKSDAKLMPGKRAKAAGCAGRIYNTLHNNDL